MVSKLADRVFARSQGFLEPNERIRRVMLAQGGINPWAQVVFFLPGLIGTRILADAAGAGVAGAALFGALGGVLGAAVAAPLISRRVVLVTDRGVVVLEYRRFGGVKPTRVIARLPQDTVIGPLSGTWAKIELAGERLWVHKKWHGAAAVFEPTPLG
ncbi:hypothetical protein ACIPSA_04545 [Streptomyces sp. NPDC086549]|uniref:hypothetical protein n=1 Tax=Streptomyces sp. NPDC086549 TaxID=3365752 RepID=UPI0037F62D5D